MPARTPIPRLTQTGNGFGGFTVNPSIPYPGGRVLTSDVEDAANAMNFGGTPSQRFNPSPTPSPAPTSAPPFQGDPSGAGLVSHEIRDFYNGQFPRSYWQDAPSDNIGINAGVDYTPPRTGTGRPPSLIDDPNNDWTGTDPLSQARPRTDGLPTDPGVDEGPGLFPTQDPPDLVTLYKGNPGDHGAPVWWDTNNRGSNRVGLAPWWIGFNPALGNDIHSTFTGPGFDNNYDPGIVSGGPKPDLLPGEAWVDLGDYSNSAVAPTDRADPGFVDPSAGLEPTDPGGNRSTGGGTITNSVGGSPSGLTIVGYDSNNHQPIYRDSAGKLYVNPGTGVASGGMPQNVRFADNGVTGNYVADKTTDAFVAAGGYAGSPNRQVAPDSGRDTFGGSTGRLDTETGIINKVASTGPGIAFSMSQKSGAPTLRPGDPKSAAAYNAWLMQQPEYKAFMQRMLGAGATSSFRTSGGPTPRSGSGGG